MIQNLFWSILLLLLLCCALLCLYEHLKVFMYVLVKIFWYRVYSFIFVHIQKWFKTQILPISNTLWRYFYERYEKLLVIWSKIILLSKERKWIESDISRLPEFSDISQNIYRVIQNLRPPPLSSRNLKSPSETDHGAL